MFLLLSFQLIAWGQDLPPQPWDLIESPDGRINGLLRNPVWRWQTPGAGLREPCDDCPCGVFENQQWSTSNPDGGASGAAHPCTNNFLHVNDSVDNCLIFSGQPGYHLNWQPVVYEGWIRWDGHSSPIFDDDEYNFRIGRPDQALLTRGRVDVQLEFDASETVDHFDGTGTWWDQFHHHYVDSGFDKAHARVQGAFAIVVGMLGFDLAHSQHQSELHPVYAMFVRLPESQQPHPSTEDRWAFFVRNWGNEGYCGQYNEPMASTIQVRLIPQQQAGLVATTNRLVYQGHFAEYFWAFSNNYMPEDKCAANTTANITNDGLVTVILPDWGWGCGVVGDFIMRKGPGGPLSNEIAPSTTMAGPPAGFNATAPESEQGMEGDPVLKAKVAKLSPAARRRLEAQVAKQMKQPRSKRPKRRIVLSSAVPLLNPPAVTGKGLKAVPNPAWQAREDKRRQLIEAFLKAHGVQ